MKNDLGVPAHGLDQHGLQIAAVDHPIRCAKALLGGRTERRAHERARGPCVDNPKLFGSNDTLPQLIPETQGEQDPRRVGRELNAGADFLQALRLVEDGDTKATLRNR
jgi:hypothetical protein